MSGVFDRKAALAVLGLGLDADGETVARAFRKAVKQAHPDRGGDARQLQKIVEAYRCLQHETPAPSATATALPPAEPRQPVVEITARVALFGGEALGRTPDGRILTVRLDPGMRAGQPVSSGSDQFVVAMRDPDVTVRGNDLWINHTVDDMVLSEGGRLAVDAPCGRRCFWINRKVATRRLVRLPGDGLPAVEGYRQGDLFIRLVSRETPVESPARVLLRRFAAAWAA